MDQLAAAERVAAVRRQARRRIVRHHSLAQEVAGYIHLYAMFD